ncbi:MAG TPA: alpha-ketoglutarate-dependent dioxygenase AlkB [Oxalicibacterium sp.]|nr:alpha-ketoglutarate-dependent dioxygenase AlkB [Oxalicibacterium sp.]
MSGTLDLFRTSQLQTLTIPGANVQWMPALFDDGEATALFEALSTSIEWRQEDILIFGKRVPQPRLTAWYGDADAPYRYSGLQLTPRPWTALLLQIRQRVEEVTRVQYNSVLLNLYRDGKDSMGWHSDDEPELGDEPTIASLSFGQPRPFQLKPKKRDSGKIVSIELTSGSLLVMRGATQRNFLHAIPKSSRIHAPRINLTFRMIVPLATRRDANRGKSVGNAPPS